MPSLGDVVGSLTGSSGADAAEEAAKLQAQAGQKAIGGIEAGIASAQERLDPYQQSGAGALDRYVDLLGGRRFAETPYGQQLQERQLETARREMQGLGLGGGARLKRLMQESAFTTDQLRQNQLDNLFRLGGLGAQTAGQQANIDFTGAQNIADLTTGIGAANAAGVIGAENARSAGIGNLLQLGGMAAGAFAPTATLGNMAAGASLGDIG